MKKKRTGLRRRAILVFQDFCVRKSPLGTYKIASGGKNSRLLASKFVVFHLSEQYSLDYRWKKSHDSFFLNLNRHCSSKGLSLLPICNSFLYLNPLEGDSYGCTDKPRFGLGWNSLMALNAKMISTQYHYGLTFFPLFSHSV